MDRPPMSTRSPRGTYGAGRPRSASQVFGPPLRTTSTATARATPARMAHASRTIQVRPVVGWRSRRMRRTVTACAEASRPSVARAKRRRRANWRPPPASTSASSAAIASPAPATRRHSKPRSPRSPTPRATWSSPSGSRSRTDRTAGRRGADRRGRARASWRDRRVTSPAEATSPATPAPWWVRPGLDINKDGRLRIAGADPESLAREHGTPLFVYDRARFAEHALRIQAAFASTGVPFRLRFALKANPLPEILEVFRGLGAPGTPESVGIDACSPGEVLRALECGWSPGEISFTGTNVSERDLDVLLAHRIHCNLDALSQIERYGRRAPGSPVGIRIDPRAGAGYNAHLEYSGERPTKFGIGLERLDEAMVTAARHDLQIDTVHFHAG